MPRGVHMRGRKLSEETKKKISENHAKHMLGKKHSLETKKKMSTKAKGRKTWNAGKKGMQTMSEETRRKMSATHKARKERNHLWKGGIYPANKAFRKSLEYKFWREAVFKRDDYTCVICKKRGGELNADHIKEFSNYPELRLDVANGRTLCTKCHRKTPNYGEGAKKIIKTP